MRSPSPLRALAVIAALIAGAMAASGSSASPSCTLLLDSPGDVQMQRLLRPNGLLPRSVEPTADRQVDLTGISFEQTRSALIIRLAVVDVDAESSTSNAADYVVDWAIGTETATRRGVQAERRGAAWHFVYGWPRSFEIPEEGQFRKPIPGSVDASTHGITMTVPIALVLTDATDGILRNVKADAWRSTAAAVAGQSFAPVNWITSALTSVGEDVAYRYVNPDGMEVGGTYDTTAAACS